MIRRAELIKDSTIRINRFNRRKGDEYEFVCKKCYSNSRAWRMGRRKQLESGDLAAGTAGPQSSLRADSSDVFIRRCRCPPPRARKNRWPVLLAGHAYAGAVIAAVSDAKVKSLVYIAALAPDQGETVAEVFYRDEPHAQAPHLEPDAHGFIWMPEDGFHNAFAQNASDEAKVISASVQRPIHVQCIQEAVPQPAWKSTHPGF